MQRSFIKAEGSEGPLARAIGSDWKGSLSPMLYAVAIPLAFAWPSISCALYVLVAIIWLLRDPRIERTIEAPP